MTKSFDLSVYVVTDRGLSRGRTNEDVVRRAIVGGATMIQYREKSIPVEAMVDEARALVRICKTAGVPLIVNDSVEVALAAGADGVHLGQSDGNVKEARRILGSEAIIGVSVHDEAEARAAEADGADYVAANGVFPTTSKTDIGAPLGLEGVAKIVASTTLPVVAIGGVNEGNAGDVMAVGASGVAVISAVVSADDIEGACAALRQAVTSAILRRRSSVR